jgi:NACalpha-BTF3-like transcription factor
MKIRIKSYWRREDGWVLEAIGLVVAAAGAATSMAGQRSAQNQQAARRNEELHRQAQFQKKAAEIVAQQTSQASAEKAKPQLEAHAADRASAYNKITGTIKPATKPVSRTVSPTLQRASANQAQINNAWNKIIGGAQSKLGAYQDWGLERNIAQQRGAQDLGYIGVDARKSAEISGAEQLDAAHSGDGMIAGGQLMGSAGNLLGAYGVSKPKRDEELQVVGGG